MKIENKKLSKVLVAAACAVALSVTAVCATTAATAAADGEKNIGLTYYYDELGNSALAQEFYDLMTDMAEKGEFKDGKSSRDITSMVSSTDLIGFLENGAPKIPVAVGAARDAFYLDHPELFYADVYKLTLTAGAQNNNYAAYLDSGRADNYYIDNTFSSAAEVDTAISEFNVELDKAVAAANAESSGIVRQIENVNDYLTTQVKYDKNYGVRNNSGTVTYDGHVHTAYGALVNKLAVCDGYSLAFKAVMDKLDIPCVLIAGSAFATNTGKGKDPGYENHMWNAVNIDGLWYGVDTTWNATLTDNTSYLLVGSEKLSRTHVENRVVSSSGFEVEYPVLRPLDYGEDADANGFIFLDSGEIDGKKFGLTGSGSTLSITLGISYEGKNAAQLAAEGKYLSYRYTDDDPWVGKAAMFNAMETAMDVDMSGVYVGGYTVEELSSYIKQVQYAIIDYAPDTEVDLYGTKVPNVTYDPEKLTASHIIATSLVYGNDTYGSYVPSPYVKKMTPDEKGYVKSFDPVNITLEYSDKLVYTEGKGKNDVKVTVTGDHADINDYCKVENVVWNEEKNVLSFTFTPSKYYAHNCETYMFVPTCLVGEKSGKVPDAAGLSFKMKQVVCSKVFNDGRLYMQVFGQPQFVSAVDESKGGFMDKNGQPIVGDQRSQLMLVVNEPSKEESKEMKDKLLSDADIDLEEKDILASSTYQIDLQMCGMVQKVPDGSYMQVGFGFPEGYGPNDAGVTFTVYHYTRNPDGTVKSVETVPCVVTEYGIMATVKSFSPFMICAVPASKVSGKTLYASVDGAGGTLGNSGITSFEDGKTVEYAVKADDGYTVNKILLNGKDITDELSDDKITLGYADLDAARADGNVLEVSFVSERVKALNADRGLSVIEPKIVVQKSDLIVAKSHIKEEPAKKNNAGLIAGIVVPIVLVLLIGGGVAAYFVIRKKKNGGNGNGGSGGKKTQSKTPAKTAEKSTSAKSTAGARSTSPRKTASAPKRTTTAVRAKK